MTTQELEPKTKQEVADKEGTRPGRTYVPDVDIREDEHALWLWADMPGVAREHVSVDLKDDVLTVRGDVSLADYQGLEPVYTEYNVGNFARRFTLANQGVFDCSAITARITDGVLEVRIPKAERAKPRRIDVTS